MSAEETVDYCLGAITKGAGKVNADGKTVKKDLVDDQISYNLSTPMVKGKTYRLYVKLMASEECSVAICPVWNASPNKDASGNSTDIQNVKTVSVTSTWATQRITFTPEYDCDGIDFLFGGLNGYVFFDNVKLVDTEVNVNMVTNGDFAENSTDGWSTKTADNGTTFRTFDTGNTTVEPGEPFVPDTWEFAQQGDPNFHIYLAFGQSNMEGNAQEETVDKQNIPARFKMLATTNFDNPKRTLGNWYKAITPICSPVAHLSPCEYFGRYLCENLPEEITIGVFSVAAGGAAIEQFMEEHKDDGDTSDWSHQLAQRYYDNNMYKRLVDMGKEAQKVGVIKGFLLHQGESNNGSKEWAGKVAKIYKRLCYNLGLNPDEVPLLAGETLYEDQGGDCSRHNISAMPMLKDAIPNSYVISAKDIPGNGKDPWHFSAAGYRELGKRYGEQMLKILNEQAASINENIVVPYRLPEKTYDLSGREVNANTRGIVIENGKKRVRK